MSSSILIRWCGLAAILGAVLFIIADLINLLTADFDASPSEFFTSFGFYLTSALFLVGGPLVLLGLVGLYARRPEAIGVLGLIAFLGAFFGGVLAQGAIWSDSFISPAIASEAPELLESEPPGVVIFGILLSFVLVNLGWILFGVAVLRARLYPRLAALLLIAGAVIALLLNLLSGGGPPGGILPYVGTASDILFFGAIAWMGLILFTGKEASAEQPSRVR
jgi:hypothetical protein